MKLTVAQLRSIIKEEVVSTVAEAPRTRGASKFWSIAPGLEQVLKTKMTTLSSRPDLGDARYRAELLAACEEVIEMLQQLA